MKGAKSRLALTLVLAVWFALAGLAVSSSAQAQEVDADSPASTLDANAAQATNNGPVRMARISYIQGNVTWRPDAQTDWAAASLNIPLRVGAQIWANNGATAELQFDDGSRLRLRNGVITLQTLYSDDKGEFTEITQDEGLSYLHLRTDHSIYQVNTPFASVKAVGPAGVRVGVGDAVDVAVREGSATIEGAQGKATLNAGDYVGLRDAKSAYDAHGLPPADSWDRFNQERDQLLARGSSEHLPANIGIVADDLNQYGAWRDDPDNGWVWVPTVTSPDWRPYSDGNWAWCEPFGWTWCGAEPWGWAPYHYGTWIHASYGWGWCPGPARQYWSPAVVSFSYLHGGYGWCPLAPGEVFYPSVGFGFGFGLYFSIGGCCCYYPHGFGHFWPNAWRGGFVNGFRGGGYGSNHFDQFNHNTLAHNGYVPVNARGVAGGTFASASAFGGHGSFHPLPANSASTFAHGGTVSAPPRGMNPVAGPASARVTASSFTPNREIRSNQHLSQSVANRSVYRAPVASQMSRDSAPFHSPVRTSGLSSSAGRTTLSNGNLSGRASNAVDRNTGGTREFGAASRANAARQSLGWLRDASGNYRSGSSSRENGGFGRSNGEFNRSNGSFNRGDSGFSRQSGSTGRSGYQGSYGGASSAAAARRSMGYDFPTRRGSTGYGYSGRSSGWNSERSESSGRSSYSSSGSSTRGGYSGGESHGGGSSGGSSSGGGRSSGGSSRGR